MRVDYMQKAAAYLISIALIISGYIYSESIQFEQLNETEVLTRGIVLNVQEIIKNEEESYFPNEKEYEVELEITKGQYKGRQVSSIHYEGDNPAFDFSVFEGDEVVLSLETENFVLKDVYIVSNARDKYIYILFAVFMISILLIGARQGLKTIVSLTVTGWAVIKILLPAILAGKNPIAITIIVCAGITIITLMLISGFTKKTFSAIVGTIIGVLFGGVLAKYVIVLTRVNGLGSD
jgi:uncharacterized membrane protein